MTLRQVLEREVGRLPDMKKKESPYLGYTEEEVKRMENYFFVLQFGGDFVLEKREYLFTKAEISRLYNKYMKDLVKIVNNGNEKDRNYALDLIAGMSVKPLRLH